jgi:hypothetical protein
MLNIFIYIFNAYSVRPWTYLYMEIEQSISMPWPAKEFENLVLYLYNINSFLGTICKFVDKFKN